MDTGKKPHSREKKVAEGTAQVGKGQQVNTGHGAVGSGGRTPASKPTGQARANTGSDRSAGSALGILAVFMLLPKKLRRTVLIVAVIALGFFLLRGGFDSALSGEGFEPGGYNSDPQPAVTAPVTPTPAPAPQSFSAGRDKRVVPLGGGRDTVTVMVFMCGTDLESNYKMATADLQEMTNATIGSNVNLIVETGGCKQWQNSIVSNKTNQIYKVETGGLRTVEADLGSKPMTDPATLSEFIQFCTKNYPADRNILIFWDHGGGSITGYGHDELYKNAGSMDLSEISKALRDGGCVFDWIGYDACLMATLETALVSNDYADYLIASEETEPGTGWYYTNWLTTLSQNTSISTPELAKVIIDDFIRTSRSAQSGAQVTLSLIDLAQMQGAVPPAFNEFATSTTELLSGNDYTTVSNARAGARQFAKSSRINQIDLVDFADRVGTAEARELSEALKSCIVYNNSTISHAYGLSIYFPYESTSSMNTAVATYNALGLDSDYTKCISSFASLAAGGQLVGNSGSYGSSLNMDALSSLLGGGSADPLGSLMNAYLGGGSGSSSSPAAGYGIDASTVMSLLSAFTGRSMPQEYSWIDTGLIADRAQFIADNHVDPADITVTLRGDGERVLTLTSEQWALIQTVELNVFADDGKGYIDLGLDNVFEFDGNDLLLGFDGTWLTVDGHAAAYYLVSDTENPDGSYTTCGRIPALLNGELVDLEVVFDSDAPDGVITGARPMYADVDVLAKGNIEIVKGDKIQLLCDYYGYDGSYSATYELGEAFTVGADGLTLANMKLSPGKYSVTYRLTDIYSNAYWTPAWTESVPSWTPAA